MRADESYRPSGDTKKTRTGSILAGSMTIVALFLAFAIASRTHVPLARRLF